MVIAVLGVVATVVVVGAVVAVAAVVVVSAVVRSVVIIGAVVVAVIVIAAVVTRIDAVVAAVVAGIDAVVRAHRTMSVTRLFIRTVRAIQARSGAAAGRAGVRTVIALVVLIGGPVIVRAATVVGAAATERRGRLIQTQVVRGVTAGGERCGEGEEQAEVSFHEIMSFRRLHSGPRIPLLD
jgi:hypothetical protein